MGMDRIVSALRRLRRQSEVASVCSRLAVAKDAVAWEEGKHPRGSNGRFASANHESHYPTTEDWKSQNYQQREREGWTTRPEGVSARELWALAALTPEKHHTGSESHGRDVILESMYPPDYASSPEVRFVKQFNGDRQALETIRKGLYLIYGGDTHNRRKFDQIHQPDMTGIPEIDKAAEQRRHDELLKKEREVYAKRQARQKKIGYPAYKEDEEWEELNSQFESLRSKRLSPSPEMAARNREISRRREEHQQTAEQRFNDYRQSRIDMGTRMLDEIAEKHGVKKLGEFVKS